MEPAEAVLKFLRSVGPATEAELYLRLFRDTPRESFAVLTADAATMAQSVDAVAMDLRFLSLLELTPVVLLSPFSPIGAAEQARALQACLHTQKVSTIGPVSCQAVPDIVAATRQGAIPLVVPSRSAVPAAAWLGALLSSLRTHKLVFLRQAGGLRVHGERVSLVDLESEFETLLQRDLLTNQERDILGLARSLIFERVRHRMMVALTSPLNLLHELFTVRGAGTLLRRGAVIERHTSLTSVDHARLLAILQASFEQRPNPQLLKKTYAHCYLEKQYRGAALVMQSPFGGYLNKFAVTRHAQGEGIGRDLWRAITADYPNLLWRARRKNPISAWYDQQCQSMFRNENWTVYARGISANLLPEAITFALEQPLDFLPEEQP